jgi:hypothetical protein
MKYTAADGLSNGIFDLDRRFGDVLVRMGMIKPVEPRSARPAPNTNWGVGAFREDGKPYIIASCSRCKTPGTNYFQFTYTGSNPAKMCVFHHCGLNENVPTDVAEAYLAACERFAPKEEKQERVKQPVYRPAF